MQAVLADSTSAGYSSTLVLNRPMILLVLSHRLRKQSVFASGLLMLSALFALWLTPLQATEIKPTTKPLDVSPPVSHLVPYASIIPDTDPGLVPNVRLAARTDGFNIKQRMASFGFSNVTYWFIVQLYNPATEPLKRLLVFQPTWLDRLDVTLLDEHGIHQSYRGGDELPFSHRSLPHRNINTELIIPPGKTSLLVRTHTVDPYLVEMRLMDKAAFYAEDNHETLFTGVLYGAIAAMLLYNLFLYLSTREQLYASYISYLFAFLAMHATYNGHLYPLLWPDSPHWGNWAHSVFIYLFSMAGLLFASHFLQLKSRQPAVFRLARGLGIAIFISFILTALFGGYRGHVITAILWIMVYAPFAVVLGVLALRAGNHAARYFLIATVSGFTGSTISATTVSGLTPYSYLAYHAVDIGMLIDAILLSLALADRLRLARMETENLRTEFLQTTLQHASNLEETVAARTRELREANTTKDKFFSIIAHDLRGPISGLATLFNQVITGPQEFTDSTLQAARNSTQTISQLLEQLLTWARSQKGVIPYAPQAVDMPSLLLETGQLFTTQAMAKSISLSLAIEPTPPVYADVAMIHTVTRNLINNALKYTASGGNIRANAIVQDDQVIFEIIDSGVGMSAEQQETLFRLDIKHHSQPGTHQERGTGLGLILCHEFIRRHGGDIGVRSNPDKGSTFWFSLPRYSK